MSDLCADLPTLPMGNAPQGKKSSRLGGQVALDFVLPFPLKGVSKQMATCGAGMITLFMALVSFWDLTPRFPGLKQICAVYSIFLIRRDNPKELK